MNSKTAVTVTFAGVFLIVGMTSLILYDGENHELEPTGEVETFESEQQFVEYIGQADTERSRSQEHYDTAESREAVEADLAEEDTPVETDEVVEPEMLKTDGERVFYSNRFPEHFHVISEIPELELEHNVSEISGEMVMNEEYFLIIEDEIRLLEKETLEEEWSRELDSRIEALRKTGDKLIVVTREDIDGENPCPVRPMQDVAIPCDRIYYPGYSSAADYTYNIVKMDFLTGQLEEETAFTATGDTEIEVTPEKTIVGYTEAEPEVELMKNFLLEYSSIDQEVKDRVEEVDGYQLTPRAERIEIEHAVESWLSEEEGREDMIESEVESYEQENKEGFQTTNIVKFDNQEFEKLEQEAVKGSVGSIVSIDEEVFVSTTIEGITSFRLDSHVFNLGEETDEIYSTEERIRSIGSEEGYLTFESDGEYYRIDSEKQVETISMEDRWNRNSVGNYIFLENRDSEEIEVLDLHEMKIEGSWERDEEERFVRFSEMVLFKDKIVVSGSPARVIELEDMTMHRLDHDTGNLLKAEDYLLSVERNLIKSFDEEMDEISSIELERNRTRERPVAVPEPVR